MPVFYDLERQGLGTLPASREGKSRWGGDEWPVDYGAAGRARYFFPFIFVFRIVVRFLKCYAKEVWLSSPARDIRAATVLWWTEMGAESFLRAPITAGSDIRYTIDSPKESMPTGHQLEKHGPENVHQTPNHRMCCLKRILVTASWVALTLANKESRVPVGSGLSLASDKTRAVRTSDGGSGGMADFVERHSSRSATRGGVNVWEGGGLKSEEGCRSGRARGRGAVGVSDYSPPFVLHATRYSSRWVIRVIERARL